MLRGFSPGPRAADRFYGTAKLIAWCREAGWGYRIRLRDNPGLGHVGGETSTGEAVAPRPGGLEGADLSGSGVLTHIGPRHEKGQSEPWIIAIYWALSRSAADARKAAESGEKGGFENA